MSRGVYHSNSTRYLERIPLNQCRIHRRIPLPDQLRALCIDGLRNRKLSYQLGDKNLEFKIAKGSPQGSPLSPLLWNIMMESMLSRPLPEGAHVPAFADDVIIAVVTHSRNALEQKASLCTTAAEQWAAEMGVHFNMAKSKMLVMLAKPLR